MNESRPYGAAFALVYDLLYSDKDYPAECDVVLELSRRYGLRETRTLLDAGCGTGGHALELARRGLRVTGVDRSRPMLELARQKAAEARLEVDWVEQDIRQLALGRTYDVVIAMFAALGFQLRNEDFRAALAALRRHVVTGGLFLFDVWHGPAVLSQRPSLRVREVTRGARRLIRIATPTLDPFASRCTVDQHVLLFDGEGTLAAEMRETQTVRYFFPQELSLYLELTGFEPLLQYGFPDPARPPTTADWDLGIVARAR